MNSSNNDKLIGVALTLAGAIFWGTSSTSAQFLELNQHIHTNWLIPIRLLCAGTISVFILFLKHKLDVFRIFKDKKDAFDLIIFGIFGISLAQYAYFRSIVFSDAGIATVMCYLAPILIILYFLIFHRKRPSFAETFSVILAFSGAGVIALKGQFSLAMLNTNILFWGMVCAISIAIYTLQPVRIIKKYGTFYIVGWGLLLGGLTSLFIYEPLPASITLDIWSYFNMFIMIVIGTVIAFNLYLGGVSRLGAVQGSILSSAEPISAATISYLALNTHYSTSDMIGFAMILATIFILALANKKQAQTA